MSALTPLSALSALTVLSVGKSDVRDADLAAIARMPALQHVNVDASNNAERGFSRVSGSGMAALLHLTVLTALPGSVRAQLGLQDVRCHQSCTPWAGQLGSKAAVRCVF